MTDEVKLVIEPSESDGVNKDFMTITQLIEIDSWPHSYLPGIDFVPYIKRLGERVTGIEVGVAKGETSAYLLKECPNIEKLYGVDPYLPYEDWCRYIDEKEINLQESIAIDNLKSYMDRFEFMKMTSEDAIKSFAPGSVDYVFVDGDHSYEQTLADLNMYYPLVRSGGIFFGHDINLESVRKALEEFREENKIRIPINVIRNNAWFWTKA